MAPSALAGARARPRRPRAGARGERRGSRRAPGGRRSASGFRNRTRGRASRASPGCRRGAKPTFSALAITRASGSRVAHGRGPSRRVLALSTTTISTGPPAWSRRAPRAARAASRAPRRRRRRRRPAGAALTGRPPRGAAARVRRGGRRPRSGGAASARPARDERARAAGLVGEHAVERARRPRSRRGDPRAARRSPKISPSEGAAADDQGHAARRGLEGRQAEALVLGQEDRGVGGGVAVGEARWSSTKPERRTRSSRPSDGDGARRGRAAGGCGSRRPRRARAAGGAARGGRSPAAARAGSGG